nr:hypothetical protein CFP56_00427 [Quercus suber]
MGLAGGTLNPLQRLSLEADSLTEGAAAIRSNVTTYPSPASTSYKIPGNEALTISMANNDAAHWCSELLREAVLVNP